MLEKTRAEINQIDQELVALLQKRYLCVDEVVRIKQVNNLPTLDSKREAEVIARLSEMITEKDYQKAILSTFQSIMDISKDYQNSKK